eukprot:COSAG01_NODE_52087_length_349_cov_0.880000_1_plen_54_part_10
MHGCACVWPTGQGEWNNVTFELAADTLTIIAVKGRRASLRRTIVCSVPKNPPLT